MSGAYARYMDKSLDEMAAELHYPSDTSHHPTPIGYGQTDPGYESKTAAEEEAYRDRATTRYLPFSREMESYTDRERQTTATERRDRTDDRESCTLFVSNLNYDTNWQHLKDHMKKGTGKNANSNDIIVCSHWPVGWNVCLW